MIGIVGYKRWGGRAANRKAGSRAPNANGGKASRIVDNAGLPVFAINLATGVLPERRFFDNVVTTCAQMDRLRKSRPADRLGLMSCSLATRKIRMAIS